MNNTLNMLLTKFMAIICKKMAFKISASACGWSAYQPQEPECLRETKTH
ncbi:cyclic lactone autoinducer peptide [Clostridium beijerinckii]|nr:cyclic lactone autoinducer peptide [Clostridium beijerinckii]NRT72439.1 cyclic lactone autoinducer peptide [Clostridium beijerinckii]